MDRDLLTHRRALCELIGEEHIRDASPADSIDGVTPQWITEAGTTEELARVLSYANGTGLQVVSRGGGSMLGWGNAPRGVDVILSTCRLNKVIEHAAGDMTATVQAGCTFSELQAVLAKNGQRVALDPLFADRATVGGVLACNDSGALRLAFGSLRDCLIGITVVLPDGTIAKSGGKVVKNVAGYDLPKLFIGSFGTLGVITQATFRLYPLAHAEITLGFTGDAIDDALGKFLTAMATCSPVTSAVQFDLTATRAPMALVRVEGLPIAMEAKTVQVIRAAQEAGWRTMQLLPNAWSRDEMMTAADSTIAKVSVLPTQWPSFVEALQNVMTQFGASWRLIGQTMGAGHLSIHNVEPKKAIEIVRELRKHITLTLLTCPPAVKAALDVWPEVGDALPLMRRIKSQFDPKGTLSAGRFVGGI